MTSVNSIAFGMNRIPALSRQQGQTSALAYAAPAGTDSVHFGAEHHKITGLASIGQNGFFRKTPQQIFIKAIQKNDQPRVEQLLKDGIDINCKDKWGYNGLVNALTYDHDDMARFLLDKGIDRNARDPQGDSALHVVVEPMRNYSPRTRCELIRLIATPENINMRDNFHYRTALFNSVQNGLDDASLELINLGANARPADRDGMTTLMHAAWNDQAEVADALIRSIPAGPDRRAFVNAQNKWHHTALHLARNFQKKNAIAVLMQHGAQD